jgi:hypothetical protein
MKVQVRDLFYGMRHRETFPNAQCIEPSLPGRDCHACGYHYEESGVMVIPDFVDRPMHVCLNCVSDITANTLKYRKPQKPKNSIFKPSKPNDKVGP